MAIELNDFAFIDRLRRECSPGHELPDAGDRSALRQALRGPGVLTETLDYLSDGMDATFKNGFQRTAVPRAGHSLHPKPPKTVADQLLGFLNS